LLHPGYPRCYRLVVNAATRSKDLAWLNQHAGAFGVHIQESVELALLAVQTRVGWVDKPS